MKPFGQEIGLVSTTTLKRIYYRSFGMPDVRFQLSFQYIMHTIKDISFERVLDVGCGGGLITVIFAKMFPRCKITGLDKDELAIINANTIASEIGVKNVEFICTDVEDANLGKDYDLVLCINVLQFIREPDSLIKEMNHALNDRGYVIIHVPSFPLKSFILRFKAFNQRVSDFKETRRGFTEKEMRTFLTNSGFYIDKIEPMLKGPSIASRELQYIIRSVHPKLNLFFYPLFQAVTTFDINYKIPANMLSIAASKR